MKLTLLYKIWYRANNITSIRVTWNLQGCNQIALATIDDGWDNISVTKKTNKKKKREK